MVRPLKPDRDAIALTTVRCHNLRRPLKPDRDAIALTTVRCHNLRRKRSTLAPVFHFAKEVRNLISYRKP